MKKFLGILLMLSLCFCGALAEESAAPVTDLSAYAGVWQCYGGNDSMPYLVLHADGTMEAYAWWQYGESGALEMGSLLARGAYQFDPATSAFVFPGESESYTLKAGVTSEPVTSTDGYASVPAGATLLFFESTEGNPRAYMPLAGGLSLLPTEEDLSDENIEWFKMTAVDDIPDEPDELYSFRDDGTFDYTKGESTLPGTYVMENGRLTLTIGDQTRVLYMTYILVNLDEMDEDELALYADELPEDWTVALDPYTISVFELKDDGTLDAWWFGAAAG